MYIQCIKSEGNVRAYSCDYRLERVQQTEGECVRLTTRP